MIHRSRYLVIVALAITLFSVVGCGRQQEYPLPVDGVSRFPTGEALREGDVILARSYGLIGAMFANHSEAGGKYSHGAMVYRAANGRLMMLNYRPTGMETCTPEEFFTRYNRLALVRYTGDFDQARLPDDVAAWSGRPDRHGVAALSETARYWLWKDSVQRVPPDYHLDHDEHSAMFCLELTSTVYRDCGLPDPFFRARKAGEDFLLNTANTMFKADVYEIRSPSSVLSNSDFEVIVEWLRPEFDLREEALNEEVIAVLVENIQAGYLPKRPRLGGRMKLNQVFFMYHLITKSMFWRPKQDLPDFIDTEVIENAYMMYSYAAQSKKAAKKRMLRETCPVYAGTPNPEPTLDQVRCIVREECAARLNTYMRVR
ncbi:MAG: hypothetical protein LUC93_02160 [Planctomycetaceae bacterium]|nr:hypothetical protein [Planctomycetaceae bacterium]